MHLPKEIIKGSLKLLILQTLNKNQEEYGYNLAQDIRKNTNDMFKAGEGSLYPALYNLERDGFIKSKWNENYTPRRKYYSLTESGKRYLQEEKNNWSNLIDILNIYISPVIK